MEVNVVGVTFANSDGSSRVDTIKSMNGTETVKLERDSYNEYDRNAIKVLVEVNGEFKQIGFLPGPTAAELSPQIRRGKSYNVSILGCGIYKDRPYCQLSITG